MQRKTITPAFRRVTSAAAIAILIAAAQFAGASAQTPAGDSGATGADPQTAAIQQEIDRLKKEKERAELERDLFKAQAEKFTDLSDTAGSNGDVTFTNSGGYYAEVLAYRALATAAQRIAADIGVVESAREIVLLANVDLTAASALRELALVKLVNVQAHLDNILESFPEDLDTYSITDESPLLALAAAPAILGAVADIAAFFKTDRTIAGRAVTLNAEALKAELAAAIKQSYDGSVDIILPSQQLDGSSGAVRRELNALIRKRDKVEELYRSLEEKFEKDIADLRPALALLKVRQTTLNAKLTQAISKDQDTEALEKALADVELEIGNAERVSSEWARLSTRFKAATDAVEALINALTARTGTAPSPLEAIYAVDLIRAKPSALLLNAQIVSQGAEIEVAKSAFSQGRVSYIGGTVVAFVLTDQAGVYHKSGTKAEVQTSSFKRSKGAQTLPATSSQ